MKKQIYLLALAFIMAYPFSSCKKDKTDSPVVSTTAISSIAATTATSGGDVTSEGSSVVTTRGVCWSAAASPTIADSKTTDGTGVGVFTSSITGLTPGTLYHLRAYATNSNGTGYGEDVTFSTSSLIKTISFVAEWAGGTEKWEFTYDALNNKVTKFDNYWEGTLEKTLTYDYSVAGKLTLMNGVDIYGTYDINAQGYITKDDWGGGEYASYEYNADGYVTKAYEYWSGVNHKKREIEITNGNVTKITKFADDGVTQTQVKVFTYTIGYNVNGIHQANVTDSDWKPIGNFYGNPSAKLVDFFEYWDPRENPIVKKKATFAYEFDSKDRPTTITKTAADLTLEIWSYTYYE